VILADESGVPVAELCRRRGFSAASCYLWLNKFGGLSVIAYVKGLKELEVENGRLQGLVAGSMLKNEVTREVLRKK
jgi:putative transposase